jgi:hypothetical protein
MAVKYNVLGGKGPYSPQKNKATERASMEEYKNKPNHSPNVYLDFMFPDNNNNKHKKNPNNMTIGATEP